VWNHTCPLNALCIPEVICSSKFQNMHVYMYVYVYILSEWCTSLDIWSRSDIVFPERAQTVS